jgi:hypothetical protein
VVDLFDAAAVDRVSRFPLDEPTESGVCLIQGRIRRGASTAPLTRRCLRLRSWPQAKRSSGSGPTRWPSDASNSHHVPSSHRDLWAADVPAARTRNKVYDLASRDGEREDLSMAAGPDERSELLKRDLDREIDRIQPQRGRNKFQALRYRIFTVAASAATTVLLD